MCVGAGVLYWVAVLRGWHVECIQTGAWKWNEYRKRVRFLFYRSPHIFGCCNWRSFLVMLLVLLLCKRRRATWAHLRELALVMLSCYFSV